MARLMASEDLDALLEASRSEPVLLFKHSSACGVSFAALREVERFVASAVGSRLRVAILEIQAARPLSSEVAERTGIRHESPQALILSDGVAVWNASHWKITTERLEAAAAEARRARDAIV